MSRQYTLQIEIGVHPGEPVDKIAKMLLRHPAHGTDVEIFRKVAVVVDRDLEEPFVRVPVVGKCRREIILLLVPGVELRSEEHTSELQSLMRISYAVFCLKKTHISQYNLS